ncbi:hypothetical protein P5P86_05355 [Nocardioides sp. BP30]|uniref:hypothetical protein n=1 Tax=Nocardioides sp. BP30 TaxID=3036374 RepID=UPI0024695B34|nr:hypothetical protein [Nocardioides sp. BP30]WGL53252.1 hypothetical protein P5P86_05355 [Nocardioides sp. BP30]
MSSALIRRWVGFLLLCAAVAVIADLVLVAASPVWRDNLLMRTHQVDATVTGVTDETPTASCRRHHHVQLRWTDGGSERTGYLDACGLTTPAEGALLSVWAGHADQVTTAAPQHLLVEEIGVIAVFATVFTAWRTYRLSRRSTESDADAGTPTAA